MVTGKFKSRSRRRIFVKVPGNNTVIHYRKRKPGKAICAKYGTVLAGVPRERPYKMKQMGKTKKRPERPFGGVLSSKAMRETMKSRAYSLKL